MCTPGIHTVAVAGRTVVGAGHTAAVAGHTAAAGVAVARTECTAAAVVLAEVGQVQPVVYIVDQRTVAAGLVELQPAAGRTPVAGICQAKLHAHMHPAKSHAHMARCKQMQVCLSRSPAAVCMMSMPGDLCMPRSTSTS